MGFTGVFVVARTAEDLGTLEAIEELSEGAESSERFGEWAVGEFSEEDLFLERELSLRRLVQQTGAPALIALVVDSDFILVSGSAPSDGGSWVLCLGSMPVEVREDDEWGVEGILRESEEAIRTLAGWGLAIGASPDVTELEALVGLESVSIMNLESILTRL
jgi:hypothetical protein